VIQLFISDLHLSEDTPDIEALFVKFMQEQAKDADELYVLGDLFELWIGDDYLDPVSQRVIQQFHAYTAKGGKLFFFHGNRDFLLGEEFCSKTGGKIHSDPNFITLAKQSAVLMHGDSLCTTDTEYLAYKQTVRDPQWQLDFLSQSIDVRLEIVTNIRQQSIAKQLQTTYEIVDVTQSEVETVMSHSNSTLMIHGHTHRQNRHSLIINNQHAERIVLGDWGKTGSVLSIIDNSIELYNFS